MISSFRYSYRLLFLLMLNSLFRHVKSLETQDLRSILIRKPYQKECETPTTVVYEEIDQTSELCPLPFRSLSKTTGCSCEFTTNLIKCEYVNALSKLPDLLETENTYTWSLDVRCRNFTILNSLGSFAKLKQINTLDFSMAKPNTCKYYEQNSREVFNANSTTLVRVGNKQRYASQKALAQLKIDYLNFYANNIRDFYLFGKQGSLKLNVKSLNLANNLLETLIVDNQLEICSLELENLNVSYNKLKQISIGYLILLRNFNISNNYLTTFTVDFFEEDLRSFQNCTANFKLSMTENRLDSNRTNASKTIYESELQTLDLSFNQLITLPFSFLHHVRFDRLELLNVNHNRLRYVNDFEFRHMRNLKHLLLRSNKIEHVRSHCLEGLNKLERLDLSFNYISHIPISLFVSANSSRLEYLYLNNNFLKRVPKEAFEHCTSVKYVYLNSNQIGKLKNYSFGYMYSLLELNLANNLIDEIEVNAFFIDEKSMIGPGLIEKIDLSNNRLAVLPGKIFSYLTNLRYLLLNDNKIRKIDMKTFYGVSYLISLDLSVNKLKYLHFLANRNLSSLRYLKLSNNLLKNLNHSQFSYLKSIKTLDLSSNGIEYLHECSFYGIQGSIKKLILNYNQIKHIEPCTFTHGFKSFRFVQILHNPIDCNDNCSFFFTVYNAPYAINYEGTECSDKSNLLMECSFKQYANISAECKRKQFLNSCELSEYYANSQINLLDESDLEDNRENLNENLNMGSNSGHQLRYSDFFIFLFFLFLSSFAVIR
jgi:Leucine-rich repeat (LRR) protein